jgi:hypothetical protein
MSVTTTPMGHLHYRDQLKLMRAETAAAWMVAALNWIVEALRVEPAASELDSEQPARQRYYGAFHC